MRSTFSGAASTTAGVVVFVTTAGAALAAAAAGAELAVGAGDAFPSASAALPVKTSVQASAAEKFDWIDALMRVWHQSLR